MELKKIYGIIKQYYYEELPDIIDYDNYINIEQFIKLINLNILKKNRHFHYFTKIDEWPVPMGKINSYNNAYIYLPQTDYYINNDLTEIFINYMHKLIIQLSIKNPNKYILDLRCNNGGYIPLFIGCVLPFIKTRGVLFKTTQNTHYLTDSEYKINNDVLIRFSKKNINNPIIDNSPIINGDIYIRIPHDNYIYRGVVQTKALIPNDNRINSINIKYPNIEFNELILLVDEETGSSSELISFILRNEGVKIYGKPTIGIINEMIKYDNILIPSNKVIGIDTNIIPDYDYIPQELLPK